MTLEAESVGKRFGGVEALKGVSLSLAEGQIVGLIGPNGSGKTTLLNCLSGVFPPTSGRITIDGRGRSPTCRTRRPAAASSARSRTSACSAG